MEKYIYDEKTGISYTLQGDYYLPDIALSTEEQQPVGLWGQRHARYLKQHHKVLYMVIIRKLLSSSAKREKTSLSKRSR